MKGLLLERLGDRLNPILVKEVRQALRGRYFRISFALTLLAASTTSLGWLVFQARDVLDAGIEPVGTSFVSILFACLVVATHALVPFSAFVAMGSEWDENTYDLLVLSNMRPMQIALGKVLSAGVQALLFYSAFGPFLVFAFLLRGVDLLALCVTLGGSMVASFALACLAVALSSLSRQRFARIAMMGLLAAFLVMGATVPAITSAAFVMRFPGQLHQPEVAPLIVGFLGLVLAAGVLFLLIAAARLAHPEENQSSGLRAFCMLLPLLFLGWISAMSLQFRFELEVLLLASILAQVFVAVAALFFTTEPERLGRRVRRHLPRRRVLALLAAPFLPGGGRGLWWYLLASALVGAWLVAMNALAASRELDWSGPSASQWSALPAAAGFGFVYLGSASLICSGHAQHARVRIGARAIAVGLFVGSVVLPALFGFFFGRAEWMEFEHAFNPVHIVFSLGTDSDVAMPSALPAVGAAVALVFAANALRLARGLSEVLGARRRPAAERAPLAELAEERAS